MTAQTPIKDAGEKYVNGMAVSWSSATVLNIAPGQCRDSDNISDMKLAADLALDALGGIGAQIDILKRGAGGLDQDPSPRLARLATAAATALPASTYNNGAAGVGATITANVFGLLSVDATPVVIGDLILVKSQAAAAQNGYYQVTNIGAVAAFWVLTRTSGYDQAAEINVGDLFFVQAGGTNAGSTFDQRNAVAVVGTDPLAFVVAPLWYGIFVIADSTEYNPVAAMASSKVSPLLPAGYDSFRRVGWMRDDGTSKWLRMFQYGQSLNRMYWWEVDVEVLAAQSAVAYDQVDLSKGVPAFPGYDSEIQLQVLFDPDASGSSFNLRPFGSSSVDGMSKYAAGSADPVQFSLKAPAGDEAGVPTLEYKVSVAADALTLSVSGFEDYLS